MSILVIGSLNMDMVITSEKMPKLGETLNGSNFFYACGGKGGNQAVSIGKLGGNVSMIASVGKDLFGEKLIKSLTDNNVDTKNISIIENKSTGVAVITLVDGDNFIILENGANYSLTPTLVEKYEEAIKTAKFVVLQLEIPMETVEKITEICSKYNVKVILNPAPAKILKEEVYKKTHILIVNETETEFLTGISITSKETCEKALDIFKKKGINNLIITMGAKGVFAFYNNNIYFKKSLKVNVVDTTSAGDSFIGGLCYMLDMDKSFEQALDFGIKSAGLTVTKMGAQQSLPTLEEVEKFIENN